MRWAEAELLRRFDLERVSFDDLLFEILREEARELEVEWAIIEQADGADHPAFMPRMPFNRDRPASMDKIFAVMTCSCH